MASLYLIPATVIRYNGLVRLLLKFTKATVFVFSNVSFSGSLPELYVFIFATTLFGEVSMFLQPIAKTDSSSLIRFLLQERQLNPSSFTCKLYWKLHSLGLRGSGAINTFKLPSLEAIAKHNPNDLLGMNFISSIALF